MPPSHADVRFTPVPAAQAADPKLRDQLLDTWVRVTDAGGAVGFTAPGDPLQTAEKLDPALHRVSAGRDALGVVRRDGAAAGMGLLVAESSPLRAHWRTVLRVMVDPGMQGTGAGRLLLEGLHAMARELRLEQLILSVRGGHELEGFYERFGYVEYGRHRGAVRISPADDRDEILMVKRL